MIEFYEILYILPDPANPSNDVSTQDRATKGIRNRLKRKFKT